MCNLAIFSTYDAKLVKSILSCKNNKVKIKLVITNKPDSSVIEIAKKYGIKYKYFDHTEYKNRVSHEKDIVRFLKKEKIDLVIFAHYMRLITKYFVDRFKNKIINVHPSLLPNFKGADGYKAAYDSGVEKSGCTIHYIDEGLDTGEIILQKEVHRFQSDDFYTFKDRIHDAECSAIQEFIRSMAA
ncbi:MAG: phosphoribosylglycinamide formyltransferase [Nanoarchaeota archaeon]|nr:phosphoribosylglycinamide formyltransferase [Nanoarchaeota archaeon]MBU1004474.1 phosphoribosylglycinamide formyltransferase [Nanoarchaeota archaeon]MBU1945555.1 phosphoribosylglycinamide formyltransferase [Nanoarchaeota archaeon]